MCVEYRPAGCVKPVRAVQELEPDPQGDERPASQLADSQLDDVLLRRHHDRPFGQSAGPAGQVVHVRPAVGVVVGVGPDVEHRRPEVRERSPERFGVADAAKRPDNPSTQFADRPRRLAVHEQFHRGVHARGHRRLGEPAGQPVPLPGHRPGPGLVAASQHDRPGPPQFADRFPQQSPREEVLVIERPGRVHNDNVQVPGQPAVLESIVEDEDLAFQLDGGGHGQGDPVAALQVRDVGQVFLQEQRLVVHPGLDPVPAAQDGDAQPPLAVVPGHRLDARRLAGPAEGQVADADDRDGSSDGPSPTAVEQPVADPDAGPVRQPGPPQPGPGQPHRRPARLAADQGVELLGGHVGAG
jgi:hypothetical protein